jgi:hypothetical protein
MKKENWVKIGDVAVDSGQLMVCDPCYIDSYWKKSKYQDLNWYKDIKTGKIIKNIRKMKNGFETKLPEYNYRTPNSLIKSGVWVELPEKDVKGFSYNAVCHKGGELFKRIDFGTALAFDSGFGDGVYPVYAKIKNIKDWGKRIVEVKIVME